MAIFVCFRFSARWQLRQRLQVDDYLCLAAVAAIIGYCATVLITTSDSVYGRHFWDIPLSAVTPSISQQTFLISLFYIIAAALTKLSLLTFFYRLFSPNPYSRVLTKLGIVFVTISYLIALAFWTYYNVPHAGDMGWIGPKFLARSAGPDSQITVALGALGTATDLYVIVIPFISVSGLNLSNKKKIGVLALFATGLLAVALSIASLVTRVDIYRAAIINGVPDPFWTGAKPYALAAAEINLGIVCGCVPVAVSLFRSFAQKLSTLGSRQKSNRSETSAAPLRRGIPAGLPKVPKGTLSTLLSFTRGSRRNPQRNSEGILVTRNTDVEMAPYEEIRAIDTDGNMYLSTSHLGSRRNLVGSTGLASTASG
ncbi:integral membrane protein [Xylaria grammica]|nr:integral membrane protein [Xylaria grammica]